MAAVIRFAFWDVLCPDYAGVDYKMEARKTPLTHQKNLMRIPSCPLRSVRALSI